MKRVNTVMAACTVALFHTVGAQQPEAPEEEQQSPEGIPSTPHQEQALREISGELFNRLDQDGDGSITKQEAQAETSLYESWNAYDENGDQVLNQKELAAYARTSASSGETEGLVPGRTEEGLPVTRHQQEVVGNELVEKLDADGDGSISRQEAQDEDRLIADWDRLDRNGDGKLDATELADRQ